MSSDKARFQDSLTMNERECHDNNAQYQNMAMEATKEKSTCLQDNTSVEYHIIVDIKGAKENTESVSRDHDTTNFKLLTSKDKRESAMSSFSFSKLVIVLMTCITLLTLHSINLNILRAYVTKMTLERNWYILKEAPCSQPKEHLQDMSSLALDASKALRLLGSDPVACYGTLIGALRRGNVLPWDNNVDLCLVNPIPKDLETIQEVFSSFKIFIHPYDDWNGYYFMQRNDIDGFITVFSKCTILDDLVFNKEPDLIQEESLKEMDTDSSTSPEVDDSDIRLCPDGTLPYFSQIVQHQTKPIPFPLLKAPFSSLPFGSNGSIAVPHGDVAILKYFYPDSWWLEIKPVGC